jgi:acyl-CoA thioester hydrolase
VVASFELHPVHSVSRVPLRVRFGETDLMGIVHHGSYVLYFEAARVSWLRRRGVTYQTWAAAGVHLPVVDIEIQYKRPAKFEDELIIETTLSKVTAATITFSYRIFREDGEASEPALLTTGHTRLACVDDAHAVRRIPDSMKSVLVLPEDSRLTSMP